VSLREEVFWRIDQSQEGRNQFQKVQAIPFRNYTKKRGGFFGIGGTLELWVEIKSDFMKESVERTIDDFLFLRKALVRLYPFSFIPSLNISEKELNCIDDEIVKFYTLNECRKFINSVCKAELLY
jgi:hypothetical protein